MRREKIFLIIILLLLLSCTGGGKEIMVKEVISSPEAPKAIGPYSQAIRVGDWLFCSGQIAIDPKTGQLVTGSVEEETRQVLENLGAILKEAGMDYSDVVRVTVFMSDMEDYAKINKVYAEYFKDKPPARAAVQVARLPKDVGVEISCIAVKTR